MNRRSIITLGILITILSLVSATYLFWPTQETSLANTDDEKFEVEDTRQTVYDDCEVISSYVEGQPKDDTQVLAKWIDKAGLLDSRLKRILPATDYGGLWIDGFSRRIQVALVDGTKTTPASREQILSMFASLELSEGADIVLVNHSINTLKQTSNAISGLQKDWPADKAWPIHISPQIDCNKARILVPSEEYLTPEHNELLSKIEQEYGDQIFFTTYYQKPPFEIELE